MPGSGRTGHPRTREAALEGDFQRELDLARGGDGLGGTTKSAGSDATVLQVGAGETAVAAWSWTGTRCGTDAEGTTGTHDHPCRGVAKVGTVEDVEKLSSELNFPVCIVTPGDDFHQ